MNFDVGFLVLIQLSFHTIVFTDLIAAPEWQGFIGQFLVWIKWIMLTSKVLTPNSDGDH